MNSIPIQIALLLSPPIADSSLATTPARLDRVIVRVEAAAPVASSTQIEGEEVEQVAATHLNELTQRTPGVWVGRGSGQEQLTAIRSPVLTGTGACGAFLWTENGVPIRPAGFCNINNGFELDTHNAQAVDILRGPGSALHGSNALHGVIDVRTPSALDASALKTSLEGGSDDYYRLRGSWSRSDLARGTYLGAEHVDSGSFRAQEGYQQSKVHLAYESVRETGAWHSWLSLNELQQETAGFISGVSAYRDPQIRRSNANPEAFRDARALRAASRYQYDADTQRSWQIIPYLRRDQQQFLQHFAPGQPLEDNASSSAGVLSLFNLRDERARWAFGAELEWAQGSLREFQALALSTGSPQQQAIRPAGVHYDYHADAAMQALFVDYAWAISADTELQLGLRGERLQYRYDNRAADGNLREDGSACGFGGCLFLRPADRRDHFQQLAPKLALLHRLDHGAYWLRLARGFRFPQAGELYRLQRGQEVADLDTEVFDMAELGSRRDFGPISLEASVYSARKRHFIFRDANGFNESDGRTRHRGVELALGGVNQAGWSFGLNASYAIQRYDFDRGIGAGESIRAGNEIDTAPRLLAGTRLGYADRRLGTFELELVHQGGYFMDAGNLARYPGHSLAHLRWRRALSEHWSLAARVMNIADRRYAERGDLSFGNERYFPGAGRSLFVSLAFQAPQ
jgi:iron complex outermembrane recepter protein